MDPTYGCVICRQIFPFGGGGIDSFDQSLVAWSKPFLKTNSFSTLQKNREFPEFFRRCIIPTPLVFRGLYLIYIDI